MPDSTRWASARARPVSRLKIAADNPNSESLARRSNASSPSPRSNTATGPKDSSRYRRMLSLTPSSRVGCKMLPSSCPPTTKRAPLARASSINPLMRVPALASTSEPSTESANAGSPARRVSTLAASFSTKASATLASTINRSVDMQI
ncbi:hypothetical protein D3C78_1564610 [compost metagenome]